MTEPDGRPLMLRGDPGRPHALRVSAEDPEVLLVTARTETRDCSWYLELDWSSRAAPARSA